MFGPKFFDLTGKNALVTGGTRGLGQAIALALGQMGASVCITGRTQDGIDAAIAELAKEGIAARGLVLDVRDVAVSQAAVAGLDADWPIDILVNNAGFENVAPSLDVDEAVWDAIVDTNLKGSFFCAQAV